MSPQAIPFNRSSTVGKEFQYIAEAMLVGQIAGDQTFTRRCNQLLETELGLRKALLTTSCTHALEMCALLLDIQPGDEVILPSFTFVSTANAFVLRGAKIIFCDIRKDTLNLDHELLESLVTPRTKAVVVVHYAGVACEMDEISAICSRHGLSLIEDNAHGLFGKYKGRWLGTLGKLATLSFHETKNITCGEGGALLINDEGLMEKAEILREKGTDRSRFFRGQVDKYTWVGVGSSYLPSDILAAFLFGQLEHWKEIQERRKRIWNRYASSLAAWAQARGIQVPHCPAHCEQAWHLFYLVLPSLETRQRLIDHLKRNSILAVFHYQALHLSKMGESLGGKPGSCPVSEQMSDQLLRLPLFYDLSAQQQERVLEALLEWS